MNDDASHYSSGYNSVGQASYAVAMANDAIDNARRAAAESRNRRSHSSNANDDAMQPRHPQPQPQPQQQPQQQQQRQPPPKPLPSETPQTPRRDPIPGTAEFVRNDRAESMAAKITRNLSQRHHQQQQQQQQQHQQQPQQKQSQQKQPQPQTSPLLPAGTEDLDLKTNDNAFHVIGTLLTDRLLPKLDAHPGCTHYSLDQDDVDFFNNMLPYSVRRRFVDAVRYRLQLIKSGGRMGSAGGDLGEAGLRRLTMQCQLLGLERMHQNVLLDLAQSVGKSYPINLKDQGPLAFGSAANDTQHQHQQRNVSFGLVPSAAGASPTSHGGIHDTFSSGTAGAGIWNAADNDGDATDPTLQALAMIDGSTSYEATAESLARQQIMAEIHETKLLMKGSVTPEATQFWKKHLEELSQRLVILSLEEQMSKVGQDGDAGRGRDDSGPDGDWDGGVDRSTRNRGANNDVMYAKVKQHYGPPNVPSQTEYLENNRRMREQSRSMGDGPQYGDAANHYGNNYNDGSYQPPVHHVVDAQVVYPSDGTVQSNAHGSIHNVQSHHTSGNNHVGNNFHNESSTVPSEPLKSSLRLGGKRELEELPVCDVVAPSDLPGGYMFEAQLGTKKFLATVPQGGVTKGQRFVSTMRELEIIEIPVPLGAWRDEAHECCNDGVLHPLFLNTLFFPCIALGQIMTRNGLDWQGDPANKLVSSTSCANMTVILTFWLAMNFSAFFMLRVQWERGYLVGAEHYVPIVLFNIFVLIYLINLTRVVRESIRNKYQIPEERCLGCEDCVCATFCMPCAICQMGRHTADFDTYRGTCCTKTGLPRQVELAPVTFYEDQYENADQTQIV